MDLTFAGKRNDSVPGRHRIKLAHLIGIETPQGRQIYCIPLACNLSLSFEKSVGPVAIVPFTGNHLEAEPFASRRTDFNVRAIETPAELSGISRPRAGVFVYGQVLWPGKRGVAGFLAGA